MTNEWADHRKERVELDRAVKAANSLGVSDNLKAKLIADLGPIADKIPEYTDRARAVTVSNEAQAREAAGLCVEIEMQAKAVKAHDELSGITDGLHKLHRQWCSLRDSFLNPLEAARKMIKGKVRDWEVAEREKAESEQRRLQAEADEKARKERESLEHRAEAAKRPETKDRLQAEALAVSAPVVRVEAPKSGIRLARAWTVASIDEDAFYAGLAVRPDLRGYVEIDRQRMARSKAANPLTEIPGVVFVHEVR